jgi:hypothetical protein
MPAFVPVPVPCFSVAVAAFPHSVAVTERTDAEEVAPHPPGRDAVAAVPSESKFWL